MKKVLVAEDEESIREFIVINLTRGGYTVEQADNGVTALQKFREDEQGFDVAILDIMMPELDGLSVCKELRKMSSDLGIIMLSAKTQEMDKVTGLLSAQMIMLQSRFHRVSSWLVLTLFIAVSK